MLIGKEALRDNEAFFGKFQELFFAAITEFWIPDCRHGGADLYARGFSID